MQDTTKPKNELLSTILCSALPGFMLLILGPTELFSTNISDLGIIFSDFIFLMIIGWIISIAVLTGIQLIWKKGASLIRTIIFAVSFAMYVQMMFLNKNKAMLGSNPNGYTTQTGLLVIDLIVWVLIIAAFIILHIKKQDITEKICQYGSIFLILIQLVAFVSLLISAPEGFYSRSNGESELRLSGEKQYTVSADENIIVIVLDYYSSEYLDKMLEVYPGVTQCLHDFTYYNNADCNYYGTKPSLAHMLTGQEYSLDISEAEWSDSIWNDTTTKDFYDKLHENGYEVNLYTPSTDVLVPDASCELLQGKFDNITDEPQTVDINSKLMLKSLIKMSSFRYTPEVMKSLFYPDMKEYMMIAIPVDDKVDHYNGDFNTALVTKGLTIDEESAKSEGKSMNLNKKFIVQHLMGTHEFDTDVNGFNTEGDTSRDDTARGCIAIVDNYLNELKKLGVYDNSNIIITADHGGIDKWDAQVIYFAKAANETHEVSPVTNAPINHCDLTPTIAKWAGFDYSKYGSGKTIYDYSQDEMRERELWIKSEDTYLVYRYTGDRLAQVTALDNSPLEIKKRN